MTNPFDSCKRDLQSQTSSCRTSAPDEIIEILRSGEYNKHHLPTYAGKRLRRKFFLVALFIRKYGNSSNDVLFQKLPFSLASNVTLKTYKTLRGPRGWLLILEHF